MTALGFCRTCGAELAAGEQHAESCAEDAFVFADAEHQRLAGAELDAVDDYELVRKRGGRRLGMVTAKLEQRSKATSAREAVLREQFRKGRGT